MIALAWGIGILRVARGPESPMKTAWMFCMIGLTFTLCTVHVWTAIYSYTFFLLGAGQFLANAAQPMLKAEPAPRATFQRSFTPNFARPRPVAP